MRPNPFFSGQTPSRIGGLTQLFLCLHSCPNSAAHTPSPPPGGAHAQRAQPAWRSPVTLTSACTWQGAGSGSGGQPVTPRSKCPRHCSAAPSRPPVRTLGVQGLSFIARPVLGSGWLLSVVPSPLKEILVVRESG